MVVAGSSELWEACETCDWCLKYGAVSWDWTLHLRSLMLTPGSYCQSWVELWDTHLIYLESRRICWCRGEKKLTHFLSEAFAGRRTDQSIYLLNDHWSIRTLAPELWKIPAVGTLWGGSRKTMKHVHLRAHLYKHSIFLYKRDWVIFLSLYYYCMLSLMAKNQK